MIEHCGDRQGQHAGLDEWPFHLFVESLPLMLQIVFLLHGPCWYMISINNAVAGVLVSFAVLGVLFYLGIIIAGMTSYECLFQTPASTALCGLWARTKPHLIPAVLPIAVTLGSLGEIVHYHAFRIMIRLPHQYSISLSHFVEDGSAHNPLCNGVKDPSPFSLSTSANDPGKLAFGYFPGNRPLVDAEGYCRDSGGER